MCASGQNGIVIMATDSDEVEDGGDLLNTTRRRTGTGPNVARLVNKVSGEHLER